MTDTDLVADAVHELYSEPAAGFVATRTAWVKRARAAKDKVAAATIAGLRKPTRLAEILNLLTRSEPAAIRDLLLLGTDLRRAQRTADAPLLRELTARRRTLVGDLVRLAGGIADDISAGVREEIVETLGAALVDDGVATGLQSGTLSTSGSWDGFGPEVSVRLSVVPDPTAGAADPAAVDQLRPLLSLVPSPDDHSGPDTDDPGPSTDDLGPDADEGADRDDDPHRTDRHQDDPAGDPDGATAAPDGPTGPDSAPIPADSGHAIPARARDPWDDDPEPSDRELKDRARGLARQQVRDEEHHRRAAAQAELVALEERRAAQRAEREEQNRSEARRRLDQAAAAHRLALDALSELDAELERMTRRLADLRQDRDDQADLAQRAERSVARAQEELDRWSPDRPHD